MRFYTSTGLDSCEVKLYLKNKLWYLIHDPANTLYCKAILKANDAFVALLNGSMIRTLWHHRLCHAGKYVCTHISKAVDGVPDLKHHYPFFACNDCQREKITKQIKVIARTSHVLLNLDNDSTWTLVSYEEKRHNVFQDFLLLPRKVDLTVICS